MKFFSNLLFLLLLLLLNDAKSAQNQLSSLNDFSNLLFMNELTPDNVGDYTGGNFGETISVSGNRVLVGSKNGQSQSSVFLFEYIGDHWLQVHEFNHYGTAVSIDADRVVIGSGFNDGAVFVYEKTNGVWTFTQSLIPSDVSPTHSDQLGYQVKVLGDRILVSSLYGSGMGPNSGAVYVFDFNGVNWVETQKIFASDGLNEDQYGWSLDFNENWAFVGAYSYGENRNDGNGDNSGAVYVYKNDNGSWSEVAVLTASDGEEYERFGTSVSVSEDWLMVGAGGIYWTSITGYVYAFKYNSELGSWEEVQKIIASDGQPSDSFGKSVSIKKNDLLIGAQGGFFSDVTGYAYQFKLNSDTEIWEEAQKIVPKGDSEHRYFGNNVALSDQFSVISSFAGDDVVEVYRSDGIYKNTFE